MKPIKHSIKEQIYDILKTRILTQHYAPDEKINIMTLSQEFEISNAPIREALSKLESEGLVTFTPNTGHRVVKLRPKLCQDVIETAVSLLLGSMELFSEKHMLNQLIAYMEQTLEEQKTIAPQDTLSFVAASIHFDFGAVRLLENKMLTKLYENISDLLYLVILQYYQNHLEQYEISITEHTEILSTLYQNDMQAFKNHIKKHYKHTTIHTT